MLGFDLITNGFWNGFFMFYRRCNFEIQRVVSLVLIFVIFFDSVDKCTYKCTYYSKKKFWNKYLIVLQNEIEIFDRLL